MKEEKRLLPGIVVIAILISSILVNFGSTDTTHTINKRSTDSSYYNNHYSRPDYNAKANSRQLTSSSTGAYYDQEEFGNYAAAGSHGGGHYSGGGGYGGGGHGGGGYGHGGGGGHGGGHGGGYGKKGDCNSALGLLGVLGLASYLQNVLRQMTTTMAVNMTGRRRRRDSDDMKMEDDEDAIEMDLNLDLDNDKPTWTPPSDMIGSGAADDARITTLVLPMLTAVAHAKDGLVPHRCVHRPLCKANKILTQELGDHGASIGAMVTKAVGKFLSGTNNNKEKNSHLRGDNLSHSQQKIVEAGKHGRTSGQEQKCEEYEHCILLNNLPTYGLPPSGSF